MFALENIVFAYGSEPLLDDVSLEVATGETVAVVGANGAGKTTLLRVAAGVLHPASGHVKADGFDALREPLRFRRMLGYLPEAAPVEDDMGVAAYLRFRARLKGEQGRKIRHRVSEALENCALQDLARTPLARLSLGQRRRAALAEAMLLRPRILLLDDPFAGLDAPSRAALVESLKGAAAFSSVVVTGHAFADLARCATRFVVLGGGALVAAATAAEAERMVAK